MKKLIAVAIAVLLAVVPAAAIHYDIYNTTKVWMNKGTLYICFDRFCLEYPDGTIKSQMELFGAKDGSANAALNANPVYLSNETAILCYGWAGIKSGVAIDKYGYKVNEGSPVFNEDFKHDAEQAVYSAGGDSRFVIRIPTTETTDPTLITLVCQGSDGVVFDMIEFSVNGEYVSQNSRRIAPDTRILKTVADKKLSVLISGATEIYPVISGSEFAADITLVNNKTASKASLLIHYDPGLSFVGAEFPVLDDGSITATDDPATRTVSLNWNGETAVEGDFTLARLVFKPDENIKKEFLHISVDKDVGYIKNGDTGLTFTPVNGGADIIPCLPCDINGDGKVNNKDVTALFRYVSNNKATKIITDAADCFVDGQINNKDVLRLFGILNGKYEIDITELFPPDSYDEQTSSVTNITSWTFNDGTAGNVIGVYCETEPDAEVFVCDESGTVLLREHSLYGHFFGRFILPASKTAQKVYIYARSEGKSLSSAGRAYTLEYGTSVGSGAIIGKDSHVFLNYYKSHYLGEAALPEAAAEGRMTLIKNKLYNKLEEVRARTGKNTKIIILVCTNPATVYHSLQYGEAEKGWGDVYAPTSVTQFGEFMKDDENIYMLDLRQILSEHTDKLLFAQADSHWTSIAGYYGYYLTAKKVKQDFPATKIYDLETDFDTSIYAGGGDLLNFMGASGTAAVWASVTPKSDEMKVGSDAPTAYWMGDSYYHSISPYFELLFSSVYLNQFSYQAHAPLYCYVLDDLENRKPDYLFYVWTERNVDSMLSFFETTIINEAASA